MLGWGPVLVIYVPWICYNGTVSCGQGGSFSPAINGPFPILRGRQVWLKLSSPPTQYQKIRCLIPLSTHCFQWTSLKVLLVAYFLVWILETTSCQVSGISDSPVLQDGFWPLYIFNSTDPECCWFFVNCNAVKVSCLTNQLWDRPGCLFLSLLLFSPWIIAFKRFLCRNLYSGSCTSKVIQHVNGAKWNFKKCVCLFVCNFCLLEVDW